MQVRESDSPTLVVREAVKTFGAVRALDRASLELRAGERLGLLGPNGAGKTTLLRAVTGRVRLDGGSIELLGAPIAERAPLRDIGVVPQEIALYPLLTARENLEVFGALNGVPKRERAERVDWALQWTGLEERAKRPVREFSGGMKRRLNVACGVLHRPRVVLLDEPTVGVDPQSRERIYDMLEELRARGVSVLLATHHLEEAESRCDRIAILDHGRLVAAGTLAELVDRVVGTSRQVVFTLARSPGAPLEGFESASGGRRVSATVVDLGAELPVLLESARAAGLTIEDVDVVGRGLHDVFLRLTGKELRE